MVHYCFQLHFINYTVSPPDVGILHPQIRRASCTIPFYIRDLNIHGFWYPCGDHGTNPAWAPRYDIWFMVLSRKTHSVRVMSQVYFRQNEDYSFILASDSSEKLLQRGRGEGLKYVIWNYMQSSTYFCESFC